jgi:hypothetical protein
MSDRAGPMGWINTTAGAVVAIVAILGLGGAAIAGWEDVTGGIAKNTGDISNLKTQVATLQTSSDNNTASIMHLGDQETGNSTNTTFQLQSLQSTLQAIQQDLRDLKQAQDALAAQSQTTSARVGFLLKNAFPNQPLDDPSK